MDHDVIIEEKQHQASWSVNDLDADASGQQEQQRVLSIKERKKKLESKLFDLIIRLYHARKQFRTSLDPEKRQQLLGELGLLELERRKIAGQLQVIQ